MLESIFPPVRPALLPAAGRRQWFGAGGFPGDPVAAFLIKDGLTESIGLSAITLTVISGTTAADLVVEISGALALLGITDGTQMSWVDWQTACDGNGFVFAASRGCLVYSVDMSTSETKIINWLGGLYVPPYVPNSQIPYTIPFVIGASA